MSSDEAGKYHGYINKLADPNWRLEHLYYIVDKRARRIRFRRNSIQKAIDKSRRRRKMILKARQFGVSTHGIIKMVDFIFWHKNATACILAHEQDSIEKLFRIVRRAYDFMDPAFRPEVDRGGGSKYEMFFPAMNSRIYCDLESRGDTIHYLHVSEAAFMKDPSRLLATLQTVPIDIGRVTIETTPNGMGNHFFDFWSDPNQPYEKLFFPWYFFEEYAIESPYLTRTREEIDFAQKALELYGIVITDDQIGFRRIKKAELGPLFIQEYPEDDQSCFLTSGNAAIDLGKIKELLDSCQVEPSPDGLTIYERPRAEGIYVIGADCAEGVGVDFSAASVIDAATLRQVATLRGQWRPSDYAHKLDELAKNFTVRGQAPLLAVERNNHGHAVLLELSEHIRYPNLYVAKDDRPGWVTDRVSRPIMIDALIEAIEHDHLAIQDRETLRECLTLVDNAGKIEAATGKHDDTIVGLAIALQMAISYAGVARLYENIGEKILL